MRKALITAALSAALALLPALPATAAKPRTLTVRVTFYCAKCDPSKKTATGRPLTAPGGVAVDPKYIPLGSRVFVPGFGWRVADDTGRLIKGRRLDVRLPSRGRCSRLGVRRLRVKVKPPVKGRRKPAEGRGRQ